MKERDHPAAQSPGQAFRDQDRPQSGGHKGFTDNDVPLRAFDVITVPQKNIAKVNDFVDRYIQPPASI